jgi:adsorption protein B
VGEGGFFIVAIDAVAREATLFSAIWFLVGGIDDLLVDLVYALRFGFHRISRQYRISWVPADEPVPGRIIVFVAAWQEAKVIGQMLRTALHRFDHPDYRIYVGTYPNDLATIAAVSGVAETDPRIRLVIGSADGPTTKAACLNTLWRALLRDEVAEGAPVAAVAIHDAEDVVHPLELRVYAEQLQRFAAVQLPVLPLRHPSSRFVSGHYCDEFAESHGKSMLVRQSLGAGMPLAGVGCAVRRDLLGRIADARGGAPFDASSLTEDYELGLMIRAMGGRTVLARVPEGPGGRPVAVRAYFPADWQAAVRQKARWMTGISLAGWDRTGWSRPGDLADHWMRMRDRRATLEMPVLAIAYFALLALSASWVGHVLAGGGGLVPDAWMQLALAANLGLLAWRVAVRAVFVWRAYGWRDAVLSAPRMLTGNFIALFAARRAVFLYARILAGGVPQWDKTEHHFPDDPEHATA